MQSLVSKEYTNSLGVQRSAHVSFNDLVVCLPVSSETTFLWVAYVVRQITHANTLCKKMFYAFNLPR